jgi:Fe-S cluster biogenesis protein NfuA
MTPTIEGKDLLIRTMPTPNPFALKFIANASFKDEGKATFNVPEECADLPLVRDLFSIEGVKQVHLFQNTITVTHSGDFENSELAEKVNAVLRSRYGVHNPGFGEPTPAPRARAVSADPKIEAIEEVLDRTIRPGLQADGGDVEVVELKGNELYILYQGACGGCPSSMMGTLDAIQGILRHELGDEELIVVPV